MTEKFMDMLTAGGHANSLGRTNEVIDVVLHDESRMEELYGCLFHDDAWARMRAADALEKICREHPEWLLPYVDRLQGEQAATTQPSLQWHMAQIYAQVDLAPLQKQKAIQWLTQLLSTTDVDWIVAANAMETLVQFAGDGFVGAAEIVPLLKIQQAHKSNAVVKRATRLLAVLTR